MIVQTVWNVKCLVVSICACVNAVVAINNKKTPSFSLKKTGNVMNVDEDIKTPTSQPKT